MLWHAWSDKEARESEKHMSEGMMMRVGEEEKAEGEMAKVSGSVPEQAFWHRRC